MVKSQIATRDYSLEKVLTEYDPDVTVLTALQTSFDNAVAKLKEVEAALKKVSNTHFNNEKLKLLEADIATAELSQQRIVEKIVEVNKLHQIRIVEPIEEVGIFQFEEPQSEEANKLTAANFFEFINELKLNRDIRFVHTDPIWKEAAELCVKIAQIHSVIYDCFKKLNINLSKLEEHLTSEEQKKWQKWKDTLITNLPTTISVSSKDSVNASKSPQILELKSIYRAASSHDDLTKILPNYPEPDLEKKTLLIEQAKQDKKDLNLQVENYKKIQAEALRLTHDAQRFDQEAIQSFISQLKKYFSDKSLDHSISNQVIHLLQEVWPQVIATGNDDADTGKKYWDNELSKAKLKIKNAKENECDYLNKIQEEKVRRKEKENLLKISENIINYELNNIYSFFDEEIIEQSYSNNLLEYKNKIEEAKREYELSLRQSNIATKRIEAIKNGLSNLWQEWVTDWPCLGNEIGEVISFLNEPDSPVPNFASDHTSSSTENRNLNHLLRTKKADELHVVSSIIAVETAIPENSNELQEEGLVSFSYPSYHQNNLWNEVNSNSKSSFNHQYFAQENSNNPSSNNLNNSFTLGNNLFSLTQKQSARALKACELAKVANSQPLWMEAIEKAIRTQKQWTAVATAEQKSLNLVSLNLIHNGDQNIKNNLISTMLWAKAQTAHWGARVAEAKAWIEDVNNLLTCEKAWDNAQALAKNAQEPWANVVAFYKSHQTNVPEAQKANWDSYSDEAQFWHVAYSIESFWLNAIKADKISVAAQDQALDVLPNDETTFITAWENAINNNKKNVLAWEALAEAYIRHEDDIPLSKRTDWQKYLEKAKYQQTCAQVNSTWIFALKASNQAIYDRDCALIVPLDPREHFENAWKRAIASTIATELAWHNLIQAYYQSKNLIPESEWNAWKLQYKKAEYQKANYALSNSWFLVLKATKLAIGDRDKALAIAPNNKDLFDKAWNQAMQSAQSTISSFDDFIAAYIKGRDLAPQDEKKLWSDTFLNIISKKIDQTTSSLSQLNNGYDGGETLLSKYKNTALSLEEQLAIKAVAQYEIAAQWKNRSVEAYFSENEEDAIRFYKVGSSAKWSALRLSEASAAQRSTSLAVKENKKRLAELYRTTASQYEEASRYENEASNAYLSKQKEEGDRLDKTGTAIRGSADQRQKAAYFLEHALGHVDLTLSENKLFCSAVINKYQEAADYKNKEAIALSMNKTKEYICLQNDIYTLLYLSADQLNKAFIANVKSANSHEQLMKTSWGDIAKQNKIIAEHFNQEADLLKEKEVKSSSNSDVLNYLTNTMGRAVSFITNGTEVTPKSSSGSPSVPISAHTKEMIANLTTSHAICLEKAADVLEQGQTKIDSGNLTSSKLRISILNYIKAGTLYQDAVQQYIAGNEEKAMQLKDEADKYAFSRTGL